MNVLKPPRTANRIVMFCTAINDHTSWPFWKFLQMKKIKGVTDLVMLAITTESGTFEARIDGTDYTLRNMERMKEFRPEILEKFLEKWHIPGHTYFVYGGHGMGDYLELEQWVTGLQCHELADIMGTKQYQGILFDACFMSNLDCVYYLRNNTKYIGASEGYMWEHDTALDLHIFNTYTASAMSRYKDPLAIFQLIQRDYTSKTSRGDFAVLDTTHAEALYNYCQKVVIPRIYDRVSFFTDEQQSELEGLAHEAMGADAEEAGMELNKHLPKEGPISSGGLVDTNNRPLTNSKQPATSDKTAEISTGSAGAPKGKEGRSERVGYTSEKEIQLTNAIQYEHSLYPAEIEDKHVLDLFQYLVDIAREEQAGASARLGSKGPAEPRLVLPSRTLNTTLQGKIPFNQAANEANTNDRSGTSGDKSPSTQLLDSTFKLSEGLELFNRVVISHTPPSNEAVYATRLGGLSIVAPELSAMSATKKRTNYHRAAFKKKAAEFLKKKEKSKDKEKRSDGDTAVCESKPSRDEIKPDGQFNNSIPTPDEKRIESQHPTAAMGLSSSGADILEGELSAATIHNLVSAFEEKDRPLVDLPPRNNEAIQSEMSSPKVQRNI